MQLAGPFCRPSEAARRTRRGLLGVGQPAVIFCCLQAATILHLVGRAHCRKEEEIRLEAVLANRTAVRHHAKAQEEAAVSKQVALSPTASQQRQVRTASVPGRPARRPDGLGKTAAAGTTKARGGATGQRMAELSQQARKASAHGAPVEWSAAVAAARVAAVGSGPRRQPVDCRQKRFGTGCRLSKILDESCCTAYTPTGREDESELQCLLTLEDFKGMVRSDTAGAISREEFKSKLLEIRQIHGFPAEVAKAKADTAAEAAADHQTRAVRREARKRNSLVEKYGDIIHDDLDEIFDRFKQSTGLASWTSFASGRRGSSGTTPTRHPMDKVNGKAFRTMLRWVAAQGAVPRWTEETDKRAFQTYGSKDGRLPVTPDCLALRLSQLNTRSSEYASLPAITPSEAIVMIQEVKKLRAKVEAVDANEPIPLGTVRGTHAVV